jgi:hypothetical protein
MSIIEALDLPRFKGAMSAGDHMVRSLLSKPGVDLLTTARRISTNKGKE